MSGGHWQYSGARLGNALYEISEDPDVCTRWPAVGSLCAALAYALYGAERAMDWDLSGDAHIEDDGAFQDAFVWSVLEAAMKLAPDRLFPRGKWGTIQAVQQRHDEQVPGGPRGETG
jgi:hypothetical protein